MRKSPANRFTRFALPTRWFLFVPFCLPAIVSCTTAGSFERGGVNLDSSSPRELLAEARTYLKQENPAPAVTRLQGLLARYPESPEAVEGHYWLGLAYDQLGGLRDAIMSLDVYLSRAPDGQYAADARARLARLRDSYESVFPTSDEINQRIAALREARQANPDSLDVAKDLAEALWLRGDYNAAGELYFEILERQPSFAETETFQDRIELHPDGSHTLLTPTELSRREKERNPIQVVNLSAFSAVRDTFTQVPRYFVVTGQAVNRSDSVLYGVDINITIYGFGNVVYDTRTYPLGDMYPGETRAFSVRFGNFRELISIDRYDYTVSFRR